MQSTVCRWVLTFVVTGAVLFAGSPAGASDAFSDVPDDHPFHDEIGWLAESGITEGFPDGTFRPGIDVTRQAIAAYLYRYRGSPAFTPPGTPTFSDVPTTHPFFLEIEWLNNSGITTGFADGTFRPGVDVTRQAVAAYFQRLAGEPPFTPPASPTFTDVGTGHPFYEEIEWLNDSGITTGFADGTFRPGIDVTRQAIAAYFFRYDEAFGFSCTDPTVLPADECDALVALYEQTDGPNWVNNTGWLTDPNPCTWHGISCTEGATPRHVIEIDLVLNGLAGSLPPELAQLGELVVLEFSDNQVTGSIPAELGDLAKLDYLFLDNNQLSGPIPPGIDFAAMVDLALNSNGCLSASSAAQNIALDSFDPDWSDGCSAACPTQTQLPVSECNALGDLYAHTGGHQWEDATNWISGPNPCAWDGVVCASPTAPTKVTEVNLIANGLLGSLPASLGDLTEVWSLRLTNNQIGGPIPPELGSLSEMFVLYLNANQLTGTIPASLANLAKLDVLHLSDNQLSGSLPPELGDLDLLLFLAAEHNQLTGPIPPELGDLENLAYLELAGNQLTGSLPNELGGLSKLEIVDLSDNQLTGTIPDTVGQLTALTELYLGGNSLAGVVPTAVLDLTNVVAADFSPNGCLTAASLGVHEWLTSFDPMWADGCM